MGPASVSPPVFYPDEAVSILHTLLSVQLPSSTCKAPFSSGKSSVLGANPGHNPHPTFCGIGTASVGPRWCSSRSRPE